MRWLSIENLTLLGIFLALALGLWEPEMALHLKIVGQIFLSLLKMVIPLLIFASVFISVATIESWRQLRQIGTKTLAYYLITTALAVSTGLVFVNLWKPGIEAAMSSQVNHIKPFSLERLLSSLIPANPVESLAQGHVLQIITFALLLGLATIGLPATSRKTLINFFEALNSALINLVRGIIWLTPVGVFALVSSIVAEHGLSPFLALGRYALTVISGLLFHGIVTLGLLLWGLGRISPWAYFLRVREALLVAFSTASSSATLPISLEVAQEKARLNPSVTGFVLPLGSTVNMDGTALYEAVAAMFIANVYHIHLGIADQILIFLTATLASIGAAGIPSAGLVTMTLVLQSVGLPLEGIGIILAIDRFLDMLRTAVNVWGDLVGARIISCLTNV